MDELAEEREQTVSRIASLEAAFDDVVASIEGVGNDDEHDPDGSTIAFERAQVIALRDDARRRVLLLDRALASLDEGTEPDYVFLQDGFWYAYDLAGQRAAVARHLFARAAVEIGQCHSISVACKRQHCRLADAEHHPVARQVGGEEQFGRPGEQFLAVLQRGEHQPGP